MSVLNIKISAKVIFCRGHGLSVVRGQNVSAVLNIRFGSNNFLYRVRMMRLSEVARCRSRGRCPGVREQEQEGGVHIARWRR